MRYTWSVVILSIVVGLFLWGADIGIARLLKFIIPTRRGRYTLASAFLAKALQPLQLSGAGRPPVHYFLRAGASMPVRNLNDQFILTPRPDGGLG